MYLIMDEGWTLEEDESSIGMLYKAEKYGYK